MRRLYAIRDTLANDLAGQFPVVCFRTDAQAIRYFGDSMAANETTLHKHAADYELLYLGTLHESGQITQVTPQIIITGAALLAAVTKDQPIKLEA